MNKNKTSVNGFMQISNWGKKEGKYLKKNYKIVEIEVYKKYLNI